MSSKDTAPPTSGGSYTVDPKTGEYTKAAGTKPPVPGPGPRPAPDAAENKDADA